MYKVILYYKFAEVENVPHFCANHRRKCRELGLKGRIYIAQEGINGTVAGTEKQIKAYKEYVCSLLGFEDTEFKDDTCEYIPFVKLIVRIRPEIVTLKSSVPINLIKEKGNHLTPRQWRRVLESGEDITLLDVRNNYESAIGHFEGAVLPDAENFFDFEQWLDQASLNKEKKVLMYCTGGIRCEKFSIMMEKKGFENVYQLQDGILNYAQKEDGTHFKGKCFVFDDRLAVSVKDKEPISKCAITGDLCDTYLNCANVNCNKLFICSPQGAKKYTGCCGEDCMQVQRKRPFNPDNIYEPSRKWYTYFDEQENLERAAIQ